MKPTFGISYRADSCVSVKGHTGGAVAGRITDLGWLLPLALPDYPSYYGPLYFPVVLHLF